MEEYRVYGLNALALLFSMTNIEPILKTSLLLLTIIYTIIGIIKRLKH